MHTLKSLLYISMYKNIRCALETSVFISYFFRPARSEKRGKENLKSKTWLPMVAIIYQTWACKLQLGAQHMAEIEQDLQVNNTMAFIVFTWKLTRILEVLSVGKCKNNLFLLGFIFSSSFDSYITSQR